MSLKNTLQIYWEMTSRTHKQFIACTGVFGAIISAFILGVGVEKPGLYVLVNSSYFLYTISLMEVSAFQSHEGKGDIQGFLLQMKDQCSLLNTGVILQSILTTIAYLAVEMIGLAIFIPFFGFNPYAITVCLWSCIGSGIFSIFYALASVNNHSKVAGCLQAITLMILFTGVLTLVFNSSVVIPDLLLDMHKLPMLLVIWVISFPLAYAFGRFCYRYRKEDKKRK